MTRRSVVANVLGGLTVISIVAGSGLVLDVGRAGAASNKVEIKTLSTDPALVTGGDVLVEIALPQDVAVQNVKGRMLTLKYKGGEIKVVVPADTPVVKRIVGDRKLLTTGSTVSITGNRGGDGTVVASQVTVRAPTSKP